MKKRFKSMIALLLVSSVCLGCFGAGTVAFARASYYIDYYHGYTTDYDANNVVTPGVIYVTYDMDGTRRMDIIGCTLILIQEYNSATKKWTTVQSKIGTIDNGMLDDNDWTHTGYKGFNVTSGRLYRAVVTFYAERDGGSDSRTVTTNSVTAP